MEIKKEKKTIENNNFEILNRKTLQLTLTWQSLLFIAKMIFFFKRKRTKLGVNI